MLTNSFLKQLLFTKFLIYNRDKITMHKLKTVALASYIFTYKNIAQVRSNQIPFFFLLTSPYILLRMLTTRGVIFLKGAAYSG